MMMMMMMMMMMGVIIYEVDVGSCSCASRIAVASTATTQLNKVELKAYYGAAIRSMYDLGAQLITSWFLRLQCLIIIIIRILVL